MEVLSRGFELGYPWELMHVNDLEITDENLNSLLRKLTILRGQRYKSLKRGKHRISYKKTDR